ncbi:MAG: MFS transporter [Eubacterium sp.]|nr:MFS transporter [Eubacterium sp.]
MENKSNFGKFMLLWTGELVSSIGGGLTSFGLGVYVFAQTGSAAGMALITLLGFLPTFLFSVPAGVLADRYDRRLLMMIGDGCSALGILYILFCMMQGDCATWQIGVGVFVSATFQALLAPAYNATITDLLTAEEYSRASGLVNIAGSSRYLISPMIAGFLLSVSDVKLLMIIDICTFFLTFASTAVVKKGIAKKETEVKESFLESFKVGWQAVHSRRGVFVLILVSSAITLFMGVFQILAEPMVLAFSDAKTLGITETICASGMLVSSVYLGIRGIKKHFVRVLSISLALSGVAIFGFGIWENIPLMAVFGFGFFLMLPFANNCLDYLVRTNIPDELQGRAWGLIGFLSQIGYVVAFGCSGLLSDFLGKTLNIGVGRGAALVVEASGILLVLISLLLLRIKSVRETERVATEAAAQTISCSEISA